MQYKTLFVVFSIILAGCSHYRASSPDWYTVSTEKTLGISGIVAMDRENFLVVYDNKKINEPRLSQLNWQEDLPPRLQKMAWCDAQKLPIDLEAITAIPEHHSEFLVLESQGQVTRIRVENNHCDVVAEFHLPNATTKSNFESLALFRNILVWAERGDDEKPAKMSWGEYDVKNNRITLSKENAMDFFAPYPNKNRRSISDIAIDQSGVLWVSAASDPGDNGVFQSALYTLGRFVDNKAGIHWNAYHDIPIQSQYENVKIEGLTFVGDTLIMGSDDENFGSKIAVEFK
jgi:predicted SnoaL-like aldol condensation-catalyzing enzyme